MPDHRLTGSPFAAWTVEPLMGDASSRSYIRLTGPRGESAILMDAAGEPAASIAAFLTLARLLRAGGLAAPDILWTDDTVTLLVIEDLGRLQLAEWLTAAPSDAATLYAAAVDVLPRVQALTPPVDLPAFSPTRAAGLIAPLFGHYLTNPGPTLQSEVTGLLQQALSALPRGRDRLALRDYHAENLIWRPHRSGTDRIGLLDFQDAVTAPPEYDLASLLRDARRDVPDDLRAAMIARFAALAGQPRDVVDASTAVWSVQRNLRILGIFARLAEAGKPRYLAFMPRVRAHVLADVAHPTLTRLAPVVRRILA